MGEVVFQLDHVDFNYDGGQPALRDVSLEICAGERVVVLGSNGSGKSTLLKLLDGLYFATAGSLQAFGKTLTEAAFTDDAFNFAFRRRVGLVFQDTDVQLFNGSVFDEVAFAPLQLDLPRAEVLERVESALRDLRIDGLRERPPHRLSGGEKRRVALASVLSLSPEVWLLDEPTTGLDPRSQSWLVDFICAQGEAGRTVVTATHDLTIVDTIADRVLVFGEDHKLAAVGAPAEILTNEALLLACNLTHEHVHWHPDQPGAHRHTHSHRAPHSHSHDGNA